MAHKLTLFRELPTAQDIGADIVMQNGEYTDYEIYADDLYGFDYLARVTFDLEEAKTWEEITYLRALSSDKSSEFKECEEIRVPKSFRERCGAVRTKLEEKINERLRNHRQDESRVHVALDGSVDS